MMFFVTLKNARILQICNECFKDFLLDPTDVMLPPYRTRHTYGGTGVTPSWLRERRF